MAVASIWRSAWMRSRRGGGGGRSLRPTGGDSATASGTTATTGTTSTNSDWAGGARDLHPSGVVPSTAPVVVVEENAEEVEEDRAKKIEHIKGLVFELRVDSRGALERWLSELDVGWVLHLATGTSHESSSGSVFTSQGFRFLARSWILALRKIAESISVSFDGWCRCSQSQDESEGRSNQQPSASGFAELVQATVLKMLPFVDIVISAAKTTDRPGAVAPAEKLQVLIGMNGALSVASEQILSLQVEVGSTDGEMRELLSADLSKLDEAVLDTIVEMRNSIMAWTWTDDGGSSEIHKVTHSIASYTKVLCTNYMSVNRILHDAFLRGEYVPEDEDGSYVTNLVAKMVSSLKTKLSENCSPGDSLRPLFLINNTNYLLQEFHVFVHWDTITIFTQEINEYFERYLRVSWEPVLKCLHDHATPRCFTRYSSPLSKFESKFQTTYTAQKLWKVPDLDMRRRLRQAIVNNVIPVFTKFLEDNSIVTPKFTPTKVQNMLGELFEG